MREREKKIQMKICKREKTTTTNSCKIDTRLKKEELVFLNFLFHFNEFFYIFNSNYPSLGLAVYLCFNRK